MGTFKSVIAVSILAIFTMVGCGGTGFKSNTDSSSFGHGLGDPEDPIDPGPGPVGTIVLTPSASSVVSELAKSQTVNLTLTSANGFTGDVDVRVVMPELDAIDPKDGIRVTSSPATVNLTAGGSATVTLTIDVRSNAPSAAAQHFHVMAAKAGTAIVVSETEINLTIMPIFRIRVAGLGDANWTVNGKAINTLFNSTTVARGIDFIHHNAGVAVIFENASGVARQIHSSGMIPHQGAQMANGASYTPSAVVGSATTTATSGVYLHNDEAGSAARTLVFNVQ